VKIVWAQFAIEDRLQIFQYISQDNPIAAINCDEEIGQQVGSLIQFPEIGRPGRVEGTRELVINGMPFIVAYEVDQREVRILRILHQSQMWPGVF
jgi:toxin ParE1/3/4